MKKQCLKGITVREFTANKCWIQVNKPFVKQVDRNEQQKENNLDQHKYNGTWAFDQNLDKYKNSC